MAVRFTQATHLAAPGETTTRRSLSQALRSRFGFNLIQAPLRKHTAIWVGDFEVPETRFEPAPHPVPARSRRPLDEHLELRLLLRGHPALPQA
jgi:hypothetical protein